MYNNTDKCTNGTWKARGGKKYVKCKRTFRNPWWPVYSGNTDERSDRTGRGLQSLQRWSSVSGGADWIVKWVCRSSKPSVLCRKDDQRPGRSQDLLKERGLKPYWRSQDQQCFRTGAVSQENGQDPPHRWDRRRTARCCNRYSSSSYGNGMCGLYG